MIHSKFIKNIPAGNDSGFTLIETLIALLVFSVGILAMVSMQTSSLDTESMAWQTSGGASEAASVIENLNPLDYVKDAELADGNHPQPNVDNYAITYSVQRNALINNTMLIQVNVSWTYRGTPKNVNLVLIKPDII